MTGCAFRAGLVIADIEARARPGQPLSQPPFPSSTASGSAAGTFDDRGQLKKTDVRHLDLAAAEAIVAGLADADMTVDSVEEKPYTRKPSPPFMTSTLQQEVLASCAPTAADDARRAGAVRERLHHLHAYRLDHALSESAIDAARRQAPGSVRRDHVGPARASTPEGQERAGGARGHPSGR